jgi:hypothetical protein
VTERVINRDDLFASLTAAQAALVQAPEGSQETWRFPEGEYVLPQGLVLGASGRSLRLVGSRAAGTRTTLVFEDGGAIAGDVTGLDLSGTQITVDNLRIRARASGQLIGLRARATAGAHFSAIVLEACQGATVTALEATAPLISVLDAVVSDVRATTGTAGGVRLEASRASVSHVRIEHLVGGDAACGVEATANGSIEASMVRVEDVRAAQAEGIRLRVGGTTAELSVLDLQVEQIETPPDGGDAIGILLLSGADLDVRGLAVRNVRGARGLGVIAAAVGEVDWLVGDIREVRGTSAGAAGVRVLARASQKRVAVRDIQVEAISASINGATARPPASWTLWIDEARAALVDGGTLPPLPSSAGPEHQEDVVGLHVGARVTEFEPWIDLADPGAIFVEQGVLRRISGTALQVEGELRNVEVRGVEAWTAVRGGWVDGERVLLAQLTWHHHHTGIACGPCVLTLVNTLITGIDQGPGVVVSGSETDLEVVLATFVSRPVFPLLAEPEPLPYRQPGPASAVPPVVLSGALAPDLAVDLHLRPNHALHAEAERVPGDDATEVLFVGAHPPDSESRCDLRDPLALPPLPPAEHVLPSPVVDYRARDARSLTALMMDRARTVMPEWTETNPADMTTMLVELLANRLDHLAYQQENAVTEGFLGTALLRRSVEDHARLVDYHADPGLAATAMLRFWIAAEGLDALNLRGRYDRGLRLEIPPDTLVINPDAADISVIFATEAPLALDHALDTLTLHDDVEARATSAVLVYELPSLEVGRWLVLVADNPAAQAQPSHVVRVTRVELGTDTTRIFWDPRRPAPRRYAAATTRIYGNVVPAHHGVPLTPVASQPSGTAQEVPLEPLRPWREQMHLSIINTQGDTSEVELPLAPVSVRAPAWPLPSETARRGHADLEVRVNGEIWDRVEDLSVQGPTDECYVLRSGHGGGAALRFGDDANGAALPRGQVTVDVSMRIGLGTVGNVGSHALTQILAFGEGGDIDVILPPDAPDREELLHRYLRVTNPLAATGGRDPEPLERIRYAAPRGVRDTLSAVVPRDYERLLQALPEVAAARARVVDAGVRRVIRVTMLLRDEDILAGPNTEPHHDAERLRRWALARSRLEAIRLLGFDVELVPPVFVPLDIDLVVDARPWAQADTLALRVEEALADDGGLFDPDVSGLGGDVHVDAIHRQALRVHGVAAVRVRRLRRLQPHAIEYVETGVLPVASDEVAVLRNPYGHDAEDGIVTVTVCGGLS